MNSAGFNKRRDREAKLELGFDQKRQRKIANPERPLAQQSDPNTSPAGENRSLIDRLLRLVRGR